MERNNSHGHGFDVKKRADELRGLSGVSNESLAQARAAGRELARAGVSLPVDVSQSRLGTLSSSDTTRTQPAEQNGTATRGQALETPETQGGLPAAGKGDRSEVSSELKMEVSQSQARTSTPEQQNLARTKLSKIQQIAQSLREQKVQSREVETSPVRASPSGATSPKREEGRTR